MVKLFLLFSQILIILDFKLLDLCIERVNGLLLLFNLARKHMLTHFKLWFNIRHSCMKVTLLRLLQGRLSSSRLRDDRYLTPRNCIFKNDNSRVKPLKAHSLKSVFCSLVYLSLHVVIHNSIFNCWLVKLPDSLFAYLTQVSEWVKGLVSCS